MKQLFFPFSRALVTWPPKKAVFAHNSSGLHFYPTSCGVIWNQRQKYIKTYFQISKILKYKVFWKFLGEWFSICGSVEVCSYPARVPCARLPFVLRTRRERSEREISKLSKVVAGQPVVVQQPHTTAHKLSLITDSDDRLTQLSLPFPVPISLQVKHC